MANLDLLYDPNDRTKAFENHETGYLISRAGPGTGKTFSFLKRIEALTARGVSQDSICYLTFIKEISNAFTQDYIDKFTRESYEADKPRISTLHSFACRLLRNQGFRMGYDGELYFINVAESDSVAATTLLQDLLPLVTEPACLTIARLRNHLNEIKTAWRDTVDPSSLSSPIPNILVQAQYLFRALRVVDWDHTIPLAHELAEGFSILPRWISNIKHYLIDEFQDFNKAEQALIAFLSSHAISTVIVGDDDQSLYSTRGASPDGLRALYFDSSKDQVSLLNCFRCRETIVTAANAFQTVMNATPRRLTPVHTGGEILAYSFRSSKAEIAFIVSYLNESIAQLPEAVTSKDGTVCLFPSWRVLEEYYIQLSPHVACLRRKIIPDPERIWLEQVLKLVCTPNQRFIERLLLNQYDQIKPRHRRLIVQRVMQEDVSISRAVQLLLSENQITGNALVHAQQFCALIEDIVSNDPVKISTQIASKLSVDAQETSAHVTSLLARLGEPEVEDIIKEFSDLILPNSAIPEEDPKSVLFLTMHGSKGLTKRTVVLPGFEKAWLPGDSNGAELEEERRLFYVALTRATHRVLVTFPFNRARGDSLNFPLTGRGEQCPFLGDSGIRVSYHP
ncbi:MAG TPA: ATP-dependent helicase [Candidatus Deferrimicrobium sp.]|nr:ATP-dependent helicase [Candidatus Deferrimicrobium sp.]